MTQAVHFLSRPWPFRVSIEVVQNKEMNNPKSETENCGELFVVCELHKARL
jgi:hypothetical protein